jgi:hypothetical protein
VRYRYWSLVVVFLVCVLGQVVYQRGIEPTLVVEAQARRDQIGSETPFSSKKTHRISYRYALVPKGVHSMADYYQALTDPAVLQAYSEVDVAQLHFERLKSPLCAYVAFKRDRFVQWTTHCVAIKAGEEVLTDGHSIILARCGNLASLLPRGPEGTTVVSALDSTLDDAFPPVQPAAPSVASELPADTTTSPPTTTTISYVPSASTPVTPTATTTPVSMAPPAVPPCCVGVAIPPPNSTTQPVSMADGDGASVIVLAGLMLLSLVLKTQSAGRLVALVKQAQNPGSRGRLNPLGAGSHLELSVGFPRIRRSRRAPRR